MDFSEISKAFKSLTGIEYGDRRLCDKLGSDEYKSDNEKLYNETPYIEKPYIEAPCDDKFYDEELYDEDEFNDDELCDKEQKNEEELLKKDNLEKDDDFEIDERLLLKPYDPYDDSLSDKEVEEYIFSMASDEEIQNFKKLKTVINEKIANGEKILTYEQYIRFNKLFPDKVNGYPYIKLPENFNFREFLKSITKSTFLTQNIRLDLAWLLKNYFKVISGRYKDFSRCAEVPFMTRY